MTNPQFAAMIEKQHLKECEDSDYMILEDLFQARCSVEDPGEAYEAYSQQHQQQPEATKRMLRRETAVELPITPSKSNRASLLGQEEASVDKSAADLNDSITRTVSIDRQFSIPSAPQNMQYLLNPASDAKIFKKSSESLQKNSSTDTEYSLQPYRVIKQSSNETNTSLNSSFNVDNSSFTNDVSLEGDGSQNTTVVENENVAKIIDSIINQTAASISGPKQQSLTSKYTTQRLPNLKKQFSVDQGPKPIVLRSSSSNSVPEPPKIAFPQPKISFANVLKDSSSSTEDASKDDRKIIPTISTNVVQDEIAKLSSNIKNSTDDEKDPPFNETMC